MMHNAKLNNERIRHILKLLQLRRNLTNLGKGKINNSIKIKIKTSIPRIMKSFSFFQPLVIIINTSSYLDMEN